MKQENTLNPICPRCTARLRKNGLVVTKKHVRQRYRCSRCNYSECDDSEAMNANVRTLYGYANRKLLFSTFKEPDEGIRMLNHKDCLAENVSKCAVTPKASLPENKLIDPSRPVGDI